MVIKVDHHSSIVIVGSKTKGYFLLSGYDSTYPGIEFRGALNPIGGNHKTGVDKSPFGILVREVTEEINYPLEDIEKETLEGYASRSDIMNLQGEILDNVGPYRDFLILDPIVERNKDKSEEGRKAIVSCYRSRIDYGLMMGAKRILEKGIKMNCEGVLNVVSENKLINWRMIAWAAPVMLSHYLGKQLPNPWNSFAVPIGEPRDNLSDYLTDFEYNKPL